MGSAELRLLKSKMSNKMKLALQSSIRQNISISEKKQWKSNQDFGLQNQKL